MALTFPWNLYPDLSKSRRCWPRGVHQSDGHSDHTPARYECKGLRSSALSCDARCTERANVAPLLSTNKGAFWRSSSWFVVWKSVHDLGLDDIGSVREGESDSEEGYDPRDRRR